MSKKTKVDELIDRLEAGAEGLCATIKKCKENSNAVESLLIVLGDKLAGIIEDHIESVLKFAAMAAAIGPVLIILRKLIGVITYLGSVLIGLKEAIPLAT